MDVFCKDKAKIEKYKAEKQMYLLELESYVG